MAKEKKKKEDKKIVLERTYNIPLRKEVMHAPMYKRSKKAITAIKEFLVKHMKSDDVRLGKHINLKVWENGIRNPPHHIKIIARKDEEGKVFAELEGAPTEKMAEAPKSHLKKKKDEAASKLEEEAKKLEENLKSSEEKQQEKAKEIQSEEIKELKHDHPKTHAPKEAAQAKDIEKTPLAPKGNSEMRKP